METSNTAKLIIIPIVPVYYKWYIHNYLIGQYYFPNLRQDFISSFFFLLGRRKNESCEVHGYCGCMLSQEILGGV